MEDDAIARFNEVIARAVECYEANPPEPFVPERLKPALDLLPDDFVIVPRFCVENIHKAATIDIEARDGYGGAVVPRENAMDGFWFYHMFVSCLDGDYDVYEDMYGPQWDTAPPAEELPPPGPSNIVVRTPNPLKAPEWVEEQG